jgi:hypothetical protein
VCLSFRPIRSSPALQPFQQAGWGGTANGLAAPVSNREQGAKGGRLRLWGCQPLRGFGGSRSLRSLRGWRQLRRLRGRGGVNVAKLAKVAKVAKMLGVTKR